MISLKLNLTFTLACSSPWAPTVLRIKPSSSGPWPSAAAWPVDHPADTHYFFPLSLCHAVPSTCAFFPVCLDNVCVSSKTQLRHLLLQEAFSFSDPTSVLHRGQLGPALPSFVRSSISALRRGSVLHLLDDTVTPLLLLVLGTKSDPEGLCGINKYSVEWL